MNSKSGELDVAYGATKPKDFDLLIERLSIEVDRYNHLKACINDFVNRIKPRTTELVESGVIKDVVINSLSLSILDKLHIKVDFLKHLNDEMCEISEHMENIG